VRRHGCAEASIATEPMTSVLTVPCVSKYGIGQETGWRSSSMRSKKRAPERKGKRWKSFGLMELASDRPGFCQSS